MQLESIRHLYLRYIVGTGLKMLGIERSSALARWLARGVFEMRTPGRAVAEKRLKAAWRQGLLGEVKEDELANVVAMMYDHIARFWIETLFARRRLRDNTWRDHVMIRGEDRLRELAESQRGCLLATAYHGNITVAAMALGRIFRPVHVVVDMLEQPMLKSWQRDLLNLRHVQPIWRAEAAQHLPEVLSQGGAVLLVVEHARPRGRCIPAPFLGQTIPCYPTIGRLAQIFDVPVGVVTCCRGEETFRFELALHDVIAPCAGDVAEKGCLSPFGADSIVERTMASMEAAILKTPEQYLWSNPVGTRNEETSHAVHKPARGLTAPAAMPVDGGFATGRGTESASFRRRRRTMSAWQTPSSADTTQGNPAEPVEPAPRA